MSQCGLFGHQELVDLHCFVGVCVHVHCACVCYVNLACQALLKPADTLHVNKCTYAYAHWSPSSSASNIRLLAPRGVPVRDAGDKWSWGLGLDQGFLTCKAGSPVSTYWSSEGSQAPFLFLAVEAIHHWGHDWWAQIGISVIKWAAVGCATPHQTGLSHQEGWSLDTEPHGMLVNVQSQPL